MGPCTADIPMGQLTQIAVLGSGSYGKVTLCVHTQTGKMYALKRMNKAQIRKHKLKGMVINEKKTMLMLDGPFIVKLYRTYTDAMYYSLLVEKCQEDRVFIRAAVVANKHMSEWLQLSSHQMDRMVDMMRRLTVEVGEEVTKKGETGDTFYIVQDGILEVLVNSSASQEMVLATCLRCGDSFGELALLYNTPRTATVRAARQCHLWSIRRAQFCAVMKLKSNDRSASYLEFIEKVPVLSERLTAEEKANLVDALDEVVFTKDEDIIRPTKTSTRNQTEMDIGKAKDEAALGTVILSGDNDANSDSSSDVDF